jgi:hypothetical protein
MNALRLFVALGVALAADPFVAAQEAEQKEAPQQAPKKSAAQGEGMYQFVSGNTTLNHGDPVTLTLKNGQKVEGTFVWRDPQSNRLYVRTKPGAAPVAVAADDINNLTMAANVQEKGGVKTAQNTGETARPRGEIQTLEIYNGSTKTVHHFGDGLSRSEREQLASIDEAAANVAERKLMVQSINRSIQNLGSETTSVNVVPPAGGPSTLPYWAYPFYDYNPIGGYTPYYYAPRYGAYAFGGYPYYGYDNGYGYGYGPWAGWGSSAPGYGPAGTGSTVVVQTTGGGGTSRAELMKNLTEAQASLAQAQKNYAAVQNRAVHGPSGQIIAVRQPE